MRKKFIVEVPCTIVDRYFIFAENEEQARRKIAQGSGMREDTTKRAGDYSYEGPADDEPETHWDRAVIVGEVSA